MLCRNRWGGLEQEGFGIVYLEAAACGVPQIAGSSGGAAEAVVHGETGFVLSNPQDAQTAANYLDELLSDSALRESMGRVGRERAVSEFSYEVLSKRLGQVMQVNR
jgi:phosphatidylinositol alpha-1,6-mannosyltransferase